MSTPKYDFHGRLSAEFPSQIIVDATEICNLACIHCPHPEFKKSVHYAGRYLDPAINNKMVREVSEFGRGITQYIRYTSLGEPLVHPGIYDMLDDAVQNSGVFVTLTTNGTIMNESRVRRLLALGLHLIDISIDAFLPETYAGIRVNGNLATTRANVLRLLKLRNEAGAKTRVVVSFVEQEKNQSEAGAFRDFWKGEGADEVVIRRLHSSAGGLSQIKAALDQSHEERYPCLYPWERILLNPRGQLDFCPQDWVHGSVIADYSQTTIRDVWSGDAYQKLRSAHLSNDFSCHAFCGQCPDWKQTRWPGTGVSYADMVGGFHKAGQ